MGPRDFVCGTIHQIVLLVEGVRLATRIVVWGGAAVFACGNVASCRVWRERRVWSGESGTWHTGGHFFMHVRD